MSITVKFCIFTQMNRSIKILLLVAVCLFAGNTAVSFASSSEHRSLHFQKVEQSRLTSPDSSGEPLAFPDSRRTSRGIYQLDSVSDVEFVNLQRDVSGISSFDGPIHRNTSLTLVCSRNVTLLLQRKKLIFPFHFYF